MKQGVLDIQTHGKIEATLQQHRAWRLVINTSTVSADSDKVDKLFLLASDLYTKCSWCLIYTRNAVVMSAKNSTGATFERQKKMQPYRSCVISLRGILMSPAATL